MRRPTELISKINYCNGEFQYLHDYIIFLENLTKIQRADAIDECIKTITNLCGGLPNINIIGALEHLKEKKE